MELFTVGKIGCYLDAITHRLDKRKGVGDDVKIIDLKLRIQPFTAQMAAALDPSLYAFVRRMLFRQGDGAPLTDYKAIEFKPPSDRDRQLLTVFASPDTTQASIAFHECKVGKLIARGQKNVDGWALIVRVNFGPVDKAELEYVNDWYTEQRFVTFKPAHPSLDFDAAAPRAPVDPPAVAH